MIKLTGRRSSFRTRALIVFIALGALLIGVTPGLANAAPAPDPRVVTRWLVGATELTE